MIRRIIDRYQPFIAIGGHIHENPGKDKLGKTIVVNPGYGKKGQFAVIDINEKNGKIREIEFFGKKK